MWQTDRILTPSKPHSYAVRARCRRIWKKLEKQKQANLPHRITEAVREPLIRYQKWMRGELEDIELHEEDAFQDPRRFLIHWLMDIEDAASGSLDPSSLEPIRDLRRFLDDLRTGARSDLKDRFVKAQKTSKGRSNDPFPIAHHKLAVALC